MAKLYPPILEGVLPAFYSDTITDTEGEVIRITIPFSMNRAVSSNQVGGFALKIKTVQSSSYLYTAQIYNPLYYQLNDATWVEIVLHTNIEEENKIIQKLKVGQFYKFQLAYIAADEKIKNNLQDQFAKGLLTLEDFHNEMSKIGEIGHYSTVGIAKYTTKPDIHINDFERGFINIHKYKYTGFYSQKDKDITERVYTYRFDVYDSMNNIIATSGDCLHNSSNDVELYESYDEFELNRDLEFNKNYYIKYTIVTNNLLELSTPRYRIMQKATVDPEILTEVIAAVNYNNGYTDISLKGIKDEDDMETTVTGSFLLCRADSEHNFTNWQEISRFKLVGQFPSRWLWRDYTGEQGKTYQYSLQQYNDKDLYSNRLLSNIVYCDFEDAFLFDGERQLKIKYNPKVSSFKATLQETKVNTIGSKHPFIFRNGKAYSHEFPISGLISYQMDEENLFSNEYPLSPIRKTTGASQNDNFSMTALNSTNMSKERNFKLQVLEWLNNGKPKLFRSPSEGNYIIRLMNVSLAPNDQLGRMIHTFNSTAYEIADCTYENLAYYDFIKLNNPETPQLKWKTIEFSAKDENDKYIYQAGQILNNHPIHTVRFSDMIPGDIIHITFSDDTQEDIQIGVTGSYYIDTGVPIRAIVLDNDNATNSRNLNRQGSMTYSYYSIYSNLFDKIDYVTVTEVPTHQFIGEHNIIQEIEYVYHPVRKEWVKNPKIDILEFYYIYASKRSIEKVVHQDNKYYQDKQCLKEINELNADLFTLYQVGYWEQGSISNMGNIGYNPGRQNWTFNIEGYQDFSNNKYYHSKENYKPEIQINDNIISVEDIQIFDIERMGKVKQLICKNGANMEVAYQVRNINYNIENDESFSKLIETKNTYHNLVNSLKEHLINFENYSLDDYDKEQQLRKSIKEAYNEYIVALIDAQEEERKAEGLL